MKQNPLESPPPYEAPYSNKNSSPTQQQQQQQQQQQAARQLMNNKNDYLTGSNPRLYGNQQQPNQTPTHQAKFNPQASNPTLSYTTSQQNFINQSPFTNGSMQQLNFPHQTHLQYTTVQSLENRARSRNPMTGFQPNEFDPHQQQTQYSTMAQLSSDPIDV